MSVVSNVSIPKDTWVRVAEAVKVGNLFLYIPDLTAVSSSEVTDQNRGWVYYLDSRATSTPAPSNFDTAMVAEAETTHIIKDSAEIDVYVYCKNIDGECRVEI